MFSTLDASNFGGQGFWTIVSGLDKLQMEIHPKSNNLDEFFISTFADLREVGEGRRDGLRHPVGSRRTLSTDAAGEAER